MQDFEKLGVFYLGRPYDLAAARARRRRLLLYDSRDLVTHAVCVGHDRQRQDRALPLPARGGGHRRRPGDRHRPEGRPRQPAAHVPRAAARGLRAVGQSGRGAAEGRERRRVRARSRPSCGRRGWPSGARTASASRGCAASADFAIYTPGSEAGLPVSILKSLAAPGADAASDGELFRERDRRRR